MLTWIQSLLKKQGKNITPVVDTVAADPQKAAYNKLRSQPVHQSICLAPSVNMVFSTDGSVRACCHNYENVMGKYPNQSIQEIWQSTEALEFRKRMDNFQLLSGCGVCAFNYHKGEFEEMPSLSFDNRAPATTYPKMMEFLLSNTCNLECVMCTGELSSSIRQNRDKLPPLQNPYDTAFLEQLKPFIPHLEETRFSSSGEAFAIDMNYKLWDMIIDMNPTCEITVQTNGTMLNARIKDYLKRGNFRIGVSIDSIEKQNYETIRANARLESVLQNISHFAQYNKSRHKSFLLSYCVMRQNWHEMPAFVQYANSLNADVLFHKVWSPLTHSMHNLSVSELEEIYYTLSDTHLPDSTAVEKKNKRHFLYFVSVIHTWLEEARIASAQKSEPQTHSIEYLQNLINQTLSNYIQTQETLEKDKAALIENCTSKIAQVIACLNTDEERHAALQRMNQVRIEQIIGPIKTLPVEKLLEMAKTSLK